MSRPAVQLISGLFILAQLTLSSVGVWVDASQESAVFSAEVHVESPSDACVQPHDHRLCVLCRLSDGITTEPTSLPAQPAFAFVRVPDAAAQDAGRAALAAQPFPRGPPFIA